MNSSKGISDSEAGDFRVPRHIAVIMDGNGRWAEKRFFPRLEGHKKGAETVRMVVEQSRRLGVRYLTLYAFSTENWRRPRREVSALMNLFERHLRSELSLMLENDIRLRAIGDLSRLPSSVQEVLSEAQEQTREMGGMDLILAVSYGGRDELVNAMRKIGSRLLSGELELSAVNEDLVASSLYAPDVPDPDLLIRTSAENRLSNFLLWQLAYSEIVVTSTLWPDFTKEEYLNCLQEFSRRSRRYGLTQSQHDQDVE